MGFGKFLSRMFKEKSKMSIGRENYSRMTSHEQIFNKKERNDFRNKQSFSGNKQGDSMQGQQENIIGQGSGTIKFFNKEKGFGFIEVQGGKDLFVHITQMPRGVDFKEGDPVSFDIGEGRRGHVACNVSLN